MSAAVSCVPAVPVLNGADADCLLDTPLDFYHSPSSISDVDSSSAKPTFGPEVRIEQFCLMLVRPLCFITDAFGCVYGVAGVVLAPDVLEPRLR